MISMHLILLKSLSHNNIITTDIVFFLVLYILYLSASILLCFRREFLQVTV